MKSIIGAVLIALLLAGAAHAAPFVVADTVSGVAQCGVYLDSAPKVTIAVTAGTPPTCKYDIGNVSNGSHTIRMTAISTNDPTWGTQESAQSSPLVFVRPAAPSVPTSLSLQP